MQYTPQILFQDDFLVAINKPAGMIVNSADSAKKEYTLQDFILENFRSQVSSPENSESEFFRRGGIVHRLDKETSGVLIVALKEESFTAIQKQFKDRTVKKEYAALVHGKMVEEGEVNVPIGRLPWNRMRFGVIPQGREAYTKFKLIKEYTLDIGREKEILSLIEVYPQTGRTHQIRVHFQYVGHPIFGDALYAGRKNIQKDRKLLVRHFLHASKISFVHPKTHEKLEYEAPLSPELVDFLAKLT